MTLLIGAIAFILISSCIAYYLERETFSNLFISFWYVMTTITTIGYGDYVPKTVIGKLFALFLYVFGIAFISVVIGKVVDSYSVYRRLKEEGQLEYRKNNHFVIIGWSKKSEKTIEELFLAKESIEIVLIDKNEKNPTEHERVHYIRGDATDRTVLMRANILDASAVLIFAQEPLIDPVTSDGRTLLIASMVESLAKQEGGDIYTVVEIISESHIDTFKHIKVDEFVVSTEAFSNLMAKVALHQGISNLFANLLSRRTEFNVWEVGKRPEWRTYEDAYESLKQFGANLIADRNDFSIMTKLNEVIDERARLYVICDEETYWKIKDSIK